MRTRRQILIDWIERDNIASQNVRRALCVAGVFPSRTSWLRFLDRLLLGLGALMLAAGVIFFFAYNWNDLGRLARFGLVETLIVAALIVIWRVGLQGIAGKVTLLAVSLFVGALLALIGQTYQTGADTFELFAAWAVLILPWAVVGRFAALWTVWVALLNIAIIFYYSTIGGLLGWVFAPDLLLWVLFVLNTIALAVWELFALVRAQERWAIRLLATASGGLITTLAIFGVLGLHGNNGLSLAAWGVYYLAVYMLYRHIVLDVYVLAGGVLSVIIVVTTFLGETVLRSSNAPGALLLIGLVVIGLSGAGGWWLKQVVNEAKS